MFATVLPLLVSVAVAQGHQSRELLPAPWPVDGIERDLSDRTSTDPPLLVLIDLGDADGRGVPSGEGLETFTILGTTGTSPASLHDIQKTCEFLCGDEGETCHFIARVTVHRSLDEVGTPLAALPGDIDIVGFRPVSAEDVPNPEVWPVGLRAEPAWSPYPDALEYRLFAVEAPGLEVGLETRWDGGTSAVEGRNCGLRRYQELDLVSCSGFAAILATSRPLLVSFPDYNVAAAEPIASFELGGDSYHVVRLGLKAQTVYGFLVEVSGGWRGLFRPRDYSLLC